MAKFQITGDTQLKGSVRIGGAKNASYKIMIAALLADSESRLLNFSHISDVELVANIIEYLGAKVTKSGERSIFIDPSSLKGFEIKAEHGEQGRFSTMFIPVLLHRFGQARVPAPGGDKIGNRPLDRHFEGLKALGADIKIEHGMYVATAKKLVGTTYKFEKNTHTGTETLIMAAVKAQGRTVLENAAEEPEIDDLINFLNKMGAKIERVNNRTIVIDGVDQLNGSIYQIMPDRNEAVSYACAAIATQGDIVIENAKKEHLGAFLAKLSAINAGFEVGNYGIRFYYQGKLTATDITTEIEPGFMTDWQPLWATLMTQAEGKSLIHETIYPERFGYVPDLQKMGAKIEFTDLKVDHPEKIYNFDLTSENLAKPHAIIISGPTPLKSGHFVVRDLRHGATLILAAMIADGVSIIEGIEHVDRGYENLDLRLKSMGARIERMT